MPPQPQVQADELESQKRVTFVEPQEDNNTTGETRITTTMSAVAGKERERGDVNINPTSSYFDVDELEDDRGWVSWLVPAIVVANIAVFIAVMYVNNCPKQHGRGGGRCLARFLGRFSFQPLKENPLFGASSGTLTKMGAVEWTKIVHNHQLWRLITSIWLHAGIIHLLTNMLSLVFVGIRLEQQFGFVKVGAIYLVSGIGGGILSSLFIQKINVSSVGASGALFGLLGAMLAELITNWTIYTNKVAAVLTLVFIIAVNLVVGILPHVDNFTHIGGFITGLLLGFVLLLRPHIGWLTRRHLHSGGVGRIWTKYRVYQILLWVVSILLLLIWFIIGMVMLGRGVNGYDHCHWCRYLSCVPTSKWQCIT